MLIRLDEASDRPIYAQVADSVRAGIADGSVAAGASLPSAKQVAAALGVNQHTVLHAYQQLRDEGIVDLRRGRGAVVTRAAAGIAELYARAATLAARAAEIGVSPATLAAIVMHAGQRSAHSGQRSAGASRPDPGSDPRTAAAALAAPGSPSGQEVAG